MTRRLAVRLERLEMVTDGLCRRDIVSAQAESDSAVLVRAVADILGDVPLEFIEPGNGWVYPSEAGERRPHRERLPWVLDPHETPGDHLKPFYLTLSSERRDEIRARCREIATEVRSGRIRKYADACRRIPREVRDGLYIAMNSLAESAKAGNEPPNFCSSVEELTKCLRRHADKCATAWLGEGDTERPKGER